MSTHNHSHQSKRHNHHHNDNKEVNGNNLLIASFLNFLITFIQLTGGLLSGSYSLLSDALHNLGDSVSIFVAYLSNKISKRKATSSRTFGFRRLEIIVALINSLAMIVICIYLFAGAIERLQHPHKINAALMVIIAAIGLLANFIAMAFLINDKDKNLNVKSAYLHLLGDTLSSIAVLLGGIMIYFYKIYWLDPVLTFIIGAYIIKETWDILKQAYLILLQATPSVLNLDLIKKTIESEDEVDNVHHVHAWKLDDVNIHFECHIDLKKDFKISETEKVLHNLKKTLHDKFKIAHTTIQFEYNSCNDKSMIH